MLDILCDFLIASIDIGNGVGVQYPSKSSAATGNINQSKLESLQPKPKGSSVKPGSGLTMLPRPQTGAPGMGGGAGRTQQNFYNPAVQLSSKPQPMLNAFAAGSSADISTQNIDVNPTLLSKNQSR